MRADPRRRHRSQSHQCRIDRDHGAGDQCAGDAVSVPLRSSICTRCWMGRSATRSSTASNLTASSGLTFYDSGARSIYNTVRPVTSIADLKGLRIRVQQSELMVEMIRSLGAEPVELPYGQVLTGLSTKLIDGAENNWPSFVTTDHYKFAGFYTLTEHTMSPEVLVMSKKAWYGLSPKTDRKTLPRRSAAIEPLHARAMARSRRALAQAGGRLRRHDRHAISTASRSRPRWRGSTPRRGKIPRSRVDRSEFARWTELAAIPQQDGPVERPASLAVRSRVRIVQVLRAVPIRWRILSIAALELRRRRGARPR